MSVVVIVVDGDDVPAFSLIQLQKATARGLGELRSTISSGRPIVEREIFDGIYEDHATLIRNVLTVLEESKLKHRIYELPEGETISTCQSADRCLVTTEVMRSILNQADAEMNR